MYKAVLFDLDGTLTESGEGITRSVQYALEKFGIKGVNPDDLLCFVGPPLVKSFMKFYKFSREKSEEAVGLYRERFGKIGIFENKLYPGIPEMLSALKTKGILLAVASSKPEEYVLKILDHFDIAPFFDVVTGSLMDGRRTVKSEVIEECLHRLGMADDRQSVVMAGDTEHDVLGAREAGLDCIAVLYGYGSRKEIEAAGPLRTVSTVKELETTLLSICSPARKPDSADVPDSIDEPESFESAHEPDSIDQPGAVYEPDHTHEPDSVDKSDSAHESDSTPPKAESSENTCDNAYGYTGITERLRRQLDFSLEIDEEKNVFRQTHLSGGGRRENDAEHAWHMAVMSYLLREYANEQVDISRVMLMCLIHDIVEIDAGDTYAYDEDGKKTQKDRENAAKERIFSILPDDQKEELTALFDEFEACETADSRFAHAMDNLQPLLLNNSNQGGDWRAHRVRAEQVLGRQSKTKEGSQELFRVTESIIRKNIRNGNILP